MPAFLESLGGRENAKPLERTYVRISQNTKIQKGYAIPNQEATTVAQKLTDDLEML